MRKETTLFSFLSDFADSLQAASHLRLTIPRKGIAAVHFLIQILFGLILFLWQGIWIIFSVFLIFITAFVLYYALKIWRNYYAAFTFFLIVILQFAGAIFINHWLKFGFQFFTGGLS